MDESNDADESGSIDAVLGHSHRRIAYKLLTEHMTMALADLADEIAVWKEDSPLKEISAEKVLKIYTELYDTHVPTMEQAGIVQYDEDRDLVSLTSYGMNVLVDIFASADEATSASTERPTFEEESTDGKSITVELSLETIDVIHRALTTDKRFDKEMTYDDVIRAILTEVYL